MSGKKSIKKRNWKNITTVSAIITCILLSTFAFVKSGDVDNLTSGEDGVSSLTRIDSLQGTHGCEDGGFSIMVGIDFNRNSILENQEVDDIRNICHGKQGESGPMGVRGYWGYNGSDGIDGGNGQDGFSPFVKAHTGEYGPCTKSAIIEMGNDTTSGIVESQIKLCFENLTSGRLTDINQNTGNSFSTGCNGGHAIDTLFVFAAVKDGNCLLYKMGDSDIELISQDMDFKPGERLGFVEFRDRIWFDADDGSGLDLWSVNDSSLWKETNLSLSFNSNSKLVVVGNELVLSSENQILIRGQSDSNIDITHNNLTTANEILIYNTNDGLSINGTMYDAEIHSEAVYHNGYYWFFASSDNNKLELHVATNNSLQRMTNTLSQLAGSNMGLNLVGENIVFDDSGIFSFNTSLLTLSSLNTSIIDAGLYSNSVIFDDKVWFSCGVSGYGYEICASDGNHAWMHTDFASGMSSSSPSKFTVYEDNLFVIVDTFLDGGQLVGITEYGIDILWDHSSENHAAAVHGDLWIDGNNVYFIADSNEFGLEMYSWAHGQLTNEWIVIY